MLSIKEMIKSSLMALLLVPTLALAQSQWQEGTHYTVVGDKASSNKQVVEVFSYWCPGCYNFESIMKEMKAKLPADVKLIKANVNFLPAASTQAQDDATLAMLAARAMKAEEQFNDALFDAIHRERKTVNGMADILAIFAAAGGDSAKMEKLTKSFGIKGQVNRNNQISQGVRRVPTITVNGKYQPIFGRNMTPDQYLELVEWLSEQK